MKLRYLSIFVLTLILVNSAGAVEIYNKNGSKLDLYGKVTGMRYITKFSNKNRNNDRSLIYYGIRGENKINDKITGFGNWENEIKLRYAEKRGIRNNFTRLGFAGIKFSNIGSIDYGRNYGILHDVNSWVTNFIPELNNSVDIINSFFPGKISNGALTYRNNNFFGIVDGLNFSIQYQTRNNNRGNRNREFCTQYGNCYGYGFSVTYNLCNGISAGAAYTSGNRNISKLLSNFSDKRPEAYSLGVKYNICNNLYIAALYNKINNMTSHGNFFIDKHNNLNSNFSEKVHNLELIAQYQFNFGLRPSIGYLQSIISGGHYGKNHNIKKYISVGTSYNFNKNVSAFIDYRINLLSKNYFIRNTKISTDNIITLGINYTF